MDNLKQKLNEIKVDSTVPSNKPIKNMDSVKKYFIEPDDKTRVLDNKAFVEFVSETINKSNDISFNFIKSGKVSVNKNTITDENFTLTSGDVVRVGVLGHLLVGPDNIAIVR